MRRFEKVATPLTAGTVRVPKRAPYPGFVPIATVTLGLALITVVPCASWTATWTAGVTWWPAVVALGWTVKASLVAVGGGGDVEPDPPPLPLSHPAASSARQLASGAAPSNSFFVVRLRIAMPSARARAWRSGALAPSVAPAGSSKRRIHGERHAVRRDASVWTADSGEVCPFWSRHDGRSRQDA